MRRRQLLDDIVDFYQPLLICGCRHSFLWQNGGQSTESNNRSRRVNLTLGFKAVLGKLVTMQWPHLKQHLKMRCLFHSVNQGATRKDVACTSTDPKLNWLRWNLWELCSPRTGRRAGTWAAGWAAPWSKACTGSPQSGCLVWKALGSGLGSAQSQTRA